ncbi:hypothetical protein [Asanoa iriomotensis]|uniref:Uncharacterized protein n=1 Tax=Asanoa iriomotensis TaxID=234613 RepID=A0ABQ4CFC7_9ACTN|nr:hypothetical protein [Asanoa iriomotensis]GIF61483.1 hypothetical protein Air01nite_75780 [Asanoa iriomotensis]
MAIDLYERICRALDLVSTPMALEVLEKLVDDLPYGHLADSATIRHAIECLRSVGAVQARAQLSSIGVPAIALTPHGRRLFRRLASMQDVPGRQSMIDSTVIKPLRSTAD